MTEIALITAIYDNYDFDTEILAASIRTPKHVTEAALAGADCATIPVGVFDALFKHPLTDKGLEQFLADWKGLGFTEEEIEAIDISACGKMTVEGAPHLKPEHLPIFDCASKCGKYGTRFIAAAKSGTTLAQPLPESSSVIWSGGGAARDDAAPPHAAARTDTLSPRTRERKGAFMRREYPNAAAPQRDRHRNGVDLAVHSGVSCPSRRRRSTA